MFVVRGIPSPTIKLICNSREQVGYWDCSLRYSWILDNCNYQREDSYYQRATLSKAMT